MTDQPWQSESRNLDLTLEGHICESSPRIVIMAIFFRREICEFGEITNRSFLSQLTVSQIWFNPRKRGQISATSFQKRNSPPLPTSHSDPAQSCEYPLLDDPSLVSD